MEEYRIENENIEITVRDYGAELRSIKRKSDGKEYMWSGDAKYWNRVSPVLFPFVGKLNGQSYRYGDMEYSKVPQHGYARDRVFEMKEKTKDGLWFELSADDFWKEKYPFDFVLRIGYKIDGNKVHVIWNVINRDERKMFFSIGAHPAFWCGVNGHDFEPDETDYKVGCTIDFNQDISSVKSNIINEKGVIGPKVKELKLNKGVLEITEDIFEEDALIIESEDIESVTLKDKQGSAFIKVSFETPMLGIWSPVGKKAPFVCIEPWYGRCDRDNFAGTLEEREFGNTLEAGQEFLKEYIIEVI